MYVKAPRSITNIDSRLILQHSVKIFDDILFAAPFRDAARGSKFLSGSIFYLIFSLDDANKTPEVCLSVCPHSAHQLVVEEADVGDGQGQDFLLNRKTIINKRSSKIFF